LMGRWGRSWREDKEGRGKREEGEKRKIQVQVRWREEEALAWCVRRLCPPPR
jgi:hypothetical protein